MRKTTWVLCLGILIAALGARAGQIDIPGPDGSFGFGAQVAVLPNGNFVVTDPYYSGPLGTNVGAVYLYDGATLSIISTLTGSKDNDYVGFDGITILTNGNFVVSSGSWQNGAATNAGAVTWGSATTGVSGTISASNSIIGGTANDNVGYGFNNVMVLTNGNYVIRTEVWNNPTGPAAKAGAVTWCNGNGGTVGLISPANSLVGGRVNDQVGSNGVRALTNGNYVVASPQWTNPAGSVSSVGAVTWGNGNGGTVGLVTPSNSLVGGIANDQVGSAGVAGLTNGNYVVGSPNWNNPIGTIAQAGAATWGNGAGGTKGLITSSNSLIGGTAMDQVSSSGVAPLTNGNYVVGSPQWTNPSGPVAIVGAATWGNGNGSTVGLVTASNSLVGGTDSDSVSSNGITALTNGNYVVASVSWSKPGGPSVGAVTWGNGNGSTTGLVTPGNSLIGGTFGDQIGYDGVTALTNGNYAVASEFWNNPTGSVVNAGAVTWGNGMGGTTGLVTSSNSLVGGTTNDSVGANNGVTALTNGNYVVRSTFWNNPTGPAASVGAATWGNGNGGTVGLVTTGNSLVGGTATDGIGSGGVTALTNGNYVVRSRLWTNPTGPDASAGAATWGNGNGGTVGLVTPGNSLVGGSVDDAVSDNGVAALSNGHYVVLSSVWYNPVDLVSKAGAASFGYGNGATVGLITPANSVVGEAYNDISSFSFDYVRNRLFVGRGSSSVVTIFLPFTADHFKVTAPAIAITGTTIQITVTAQGADNSTVQSYTGTVHFTSTDGAAGLPADYTFVGGDNGVHTFNVTLNTAGAKTVTVTDTVTATITGTSASINPPLAFGSSASAQPNPAGVGQTVTFTASATGGVGALAYSWNFGDGSPVASGASVTHAYSTAGTFPAIITVTDTTNVSINATVMVTVNAPLVGTGPDSDGDGFSDSYETAVGTLPDDATSTPTGKPATAGGIQTLIISKASIKLNFAKPTGNDLISFSGTVAIPAGFNPVGAKTFFMAGGVAKTLLLTSKGSGVSGNDSIKVTLKSKKGVVLATTAAKYSVNFKKGTFAATLAGAGLTNSDATATIMVPFTFIVNNTIYQKTQTMKYTGKKGKTGSAK